MVMIAQQLVRVFFYNGVRLDDPLPGADLDEVRRVHSAMYSPISTAKVDGPDYQGNEEVYTYATRGGVNG